MNILEIITIIINIIAIVVLFPALFYEFKSPKNKAMYGYFVAGSLIAYLVSLCLFICINLLWFKNINSLILTLFVIAPFIIGKLVKYKTVKIYTVIQILCYCISLFILVS